MLWSVTADQGHCLGWFAWRTNLEVVVAHWVIANRIGMSAMLTRLSWIRARVSSLSHILLRKHSNSSPLALITRVPQGYAIRTLSMISNSISSSPILVSWVQVSLHPPPSPPPFLLWLTAVPTACSACSQFMKQLVAGEKHLQPLMPLCKDVPITVYCIRQISDAALSLTKCSTRITHIV